MATPSIWSLDYTGFDFHTTCRVTRVVNMSNKCKSCYSNDLNNEKVFKVSGIVFVIYFLNSMESKVVNSYFISLVI